MTYRDEFPDFDPATMPAIPAHWRDQSWHNDSCPCFNTGNGKIVFVEFADPAVREFPETARFTVHTDPETSNSNDVLFESEDWSAILTYTGANK